jgi:hypothetical protein
MAILAETCSVLRNFKNFKSFKNFKCECEKLTSVCTEDGELIVIDKDRNGFTFLLQFVHLFGETTDELLEEYKAC